MPTQRRKGAAKTGQFSLRRRAAARVFFPKTIKFLTRLSRLPIVAEVMMSTRNFFYFAFTYRYSFTQESGPAKFENDVLKT